MSTSTPVVTRGQATQRATARESVEVSIVMPCLNEEETLASCITAASAWLTSTGCSGEIVVADNGSTDRSVEIANACAARVVTVPLRGYGAALYFGSRASRGRFIVIGDSDDSYDFSELSPFLERLRGGDDLVMGNRFHGRIESGAMPFKNRYLGNPVLSSLGRLLFHAPIGDFHCGLRAFTRIAFDRMDLRTTGMELASEIVIKGTLLGLRMSEVPVTLRPDGRARPPHLRPWRDGWRHLRFMLLCSPRWLFLYPGLVAIMAGVTAGAWLMAGPRRIGAVTLDIHTLAYAGTAILLGYQAVLFALFTRIFAAQHGLLPVSARLNQAFRHVRLESGLLAGVTLAAGGLALSLLELLRWRAAGYGPLNVEDAMRVVMLAVVTLTLGVQTIFASLFLSVLGLGVRQFSPRGTEGT